MRAHVFRTSSTVPQAKILFSVCLVLVCVLGWVGFGFVVWLLLVFI